MPCGPPVAPAVSRPAGHPRTTAGGDEKVVAAQLAAVVERQYVVLAIAPRGGRLDPEEELNAVAAQDLAECLAQRRGLPGQDVRGPLDQGYLPAQAPHGLGHLGADRPAAQDQQPPRDGLHAGHLAVGPDAIEFAQARDGRHHGIGAGRHDHVPGGVAHAADLDHARPGQPAGAAQQVDALARQPALLPGIGVIRDHEVAIGERRLDVDLRAGPRVARGLHRLAGAQQRLGRDARPVGALPPGQLALDHRDPQAALGQRPGTMLARRAAAHHDDVIVAHAPAPCTVR